MAPERRAWVDWMFILGPFILSYIDKCPSQLKIFSKINIF